MRPANRAARHNGTLFPVSGSGSVGVGGDNHGTISVSYGAAPVARSNYRAQVARIAPKQLRYDRPGIVDETLAAAGVALARRDPVRAERLVGQVRDAGLRARTLVRPAREIPGRRAKVFIADALQAIHWHKTLPDIARIHPAAAAGLVDEILAGLNRWLAAPDGGVEEQWW